MRHHSRFAFHILVFAAGICALISTAAGFGYTTTNTVHEAGYGDNVVFTAYVMGEDGTVTAETIEKPSAWDVTVDPSSVDIPPEDDYRYVKHGDTYRRMAPIQVDVDVPVNADVGTYRITLELAKQSATTLNNNQSQAAVRQVQHIPFTVNVVEPTGDDTDEDDSSIVETVADGVRNTVSSLLGDDQSSDQPDTDDTTGEDTNDSDGDTADEAEDQPPQHSGANATLEDGNDIAQQDETLTGLTGLIPRNVAASTVLQVLVFIGIWTVLGGYVWRRQKQQDDSDENPWTDAINTS